MPNDLPVIIIFSVIGCLLILVAIFNDRLLRRLGLKPMSELFTHPNLQRSARITGALARLFLGLMGVGFLVQAAGSLLPSSGLIQILSTVLAGLLGLILVVVFGVVLLNWKAR